MRLKVNCLLVIFFCNGGIALLYRRCMDTEGRVRISIFKRRDSSIVLQSELFTETPLWIGLRNFKKGE